MQTNQTGIRALHGQSYADLDRLAVMWRKALGSEVTEPFDAKHFFDKQLGELELFRTGGNVELVEHVANAKVEGFTRWDVENYRMEVALSEASHAMLQLDHVRARFTVCHEFGHAILHTQEIIQLAGLPLITQVALHRKKEHPKCFDSEWQANAFAASLLMPAQGIRHLQRRYGFVNEDLIAQHFEVSTQSALIRLKSLQKV